MKKGFTLIEAMIVVGIIGLMAAVVGNSGNLFKQSAQTRLGAVQFFNLLKQARTLAILSRSNICVQINTTGKVMNTKCGATAPTFTNNSKATSLYNKMENTFDAKEITTSAISGTTGCTGVVQYTFDSRGMLSGTVCRALRFKELETNDYFIIESSITGSIRQCKKDSAADNCN
ncbi:type II secretion system protein [bacterium]|nr:type II secretion system protein [bacterium]